MVIMKFGKALAITTAVLLLLVGCAGKDFVRPTDDSLALGKTTTQEIRQQFGEPRNEGSIIENGKNVKTYSYSYAVGAGGLVGGVVPARAMAYFFHNDVLVGYQFVSSFSEDSTDFNESKIDQIQKNVTREGEVTEIMGRPSGRCIYPMADKDGTAVGYAYVETIGPSFSLKTYRKTLKVFFKNGTVTDVKFSSFGKR